MTTDDLPGGAGPIRLDKWLWHARFFKTRSLASGAVSQVRMRLNGQLVGKPAQPVRAGDVLTFTIGQRVVVARVLAAGTRRGPAPEARALYEDLSPPAPPPDPAQPRAAKGGRPRGPGPRSLAAPPPRWVD
ncbi:RNA-binding S4 domain-containing protein [Pararhodobacter sp. SW119]|uniref:RNA-binding S4 domain-containing protein n=1 Tax=Pararhodobacter sp. SW119 TaxID=2780075 RepID=UPI001AE0C878|nr:RNA-binding S4 domain-containing protein [Pararhodobacter sp. SW119]